MRAARVTVREDLVLELLWRPERQGRVTLSVLAAGAEPVTFELDGDEAAELSATFLALSVDLVAQSPQPRTLPLRLQPRFRIEELDVDEV